MDSLPASLPAPTAPPALIQCHGRCQRLKSHAFFDRFAINALVQALAAGRASSPLCHQCLVDRRKHTGLYADAIDARIVTPKPKPKGWAYRSTSSALCRGSIPGSASFDLRPSRQREEKVA